MKRFAKLQKKIISMAYANGITNEEIAVALNTTVEIVNEKITLMCEDQCDKKFTILVMAFIKAKLELINKERLERVCLNYKSKNYDSLLIDYCMAC